MSKKTILEICKNTIDQNGIMNVHSFVYQIPQSLKFSLAEKILQSFGIEIQLNEETEQLYCIELPNKQQYTNEFIDLLVNKKLKKANQTIQKLQGTVKPVQID